MASTAIHRLTLDPMGKYSNPFFSETTNIIKAKLYMNVHSEIQDGFHRNTIGPYGKIFKSLLLNYKYY